MFPVFNFIYKIILHRFPFMSSSLPPKRFESISNLETDLINEFYKNVKERHQLSLTIDKKTPEINVTKLFNFLEQNGFQARRDSCFPWIIKTNLSLNSHEDWKREEAAFRFGFDKSVSWAFELSFHFKYHFTIFTWATLSRLGSF